MPTPHTRLASHARTPHLELLRDEDPAHSLVARSARMRALVQTLRGLARTPTTVLLHGETGTGKDVLARLLHDLSDRRDQPFEIVDCSALTSSLIASELFGHERGAFTGAHERREGAFERANGGTVFLDEIGELPLELQPMLLGVLERRSFRRVGGSGEHPVDVRIICATHRDLRAEQHARRFRSDLYFRLAVANVVVPPLRERPEDIAPLVRHFGTLLGAAPDAFDASLLCELEARSWEGNVRELRNWVESYVALGTDLDISLANTRSGEGAPWDDEVDVERTYREARAVATAAFERGYLGKLLEVCHGNASEAARRARMDRSHLLTLLRKHGLRSARS